MVSGKEFNFFLHVVNQLSHNNCGETGLLHIEWCWHPCWENQLTIGIWVYFGLKFYSIDLYVCLLCQYHTVLITVVSFKTGECRIPQLCFFLFQDYFGYVRSLAVYMNIKLNFFFSEEKVSGILIGIKLNM